MEKFLLKKTNGYEIPCIALLPDNMRKLVIVIHGYDSSKESENAANLMRQLPDKGFGVVAYDQPHHGSEQAATEELTVENCLDSLARVEAYLTERFPETEICYFGSSFGAYILGIYLVQRPHKGRKAFLRCAAVNFPELAADEGEVDIDLPDLFALCDVVISRAGANAIGELLALRKPAVLIPLSAAASRGDQILNARSFEKQGFARMLEEENVTDSTLLEAVREVYENRAEYVAAMEKSEMRDAIGVITGLIEELGNAPRHKKQKQSAIRKDTQQ